MAGLTVKACFERYGNLEYKDMVKLLGTENFTENTVIDADKVAKYKGKCANELSIFYAQNDTQEFIPLLSGDKQNSIMQQAGINPKSVKKLNNQEDIAQNKQNTNQTGRIEQDTSIFDVAKQEIA